jgi:O-antigen/teichoic acid export membrane protein
VPSILSINPSWHARTAVVLNAFRVVAGTATLQALAQLLSFAAGLVVVRHLPVDQYAYYTLATAVLGIASTLSDSGMRNAVMAQGGAVWQQRAGLGAVVAAGLAIRRKVATFCAIVLCPALIALMMKQGASIYDAILVSLCVVPVFLATTASPLLEIPLRLHQRLKSLQFAQTVAGLLRLGLVAVVSFVVPHAWLVVLSAFLPQSLLNDKMRKVSTDIADLSARPDDATRKKISQQIARTLPGMVYYVFVSQLSVLLISLFGSTEGTAQVGALGRLALIVSFLLAVFQLVAIPRFARFPEQDRRGLTRIYVLLLSGISGAAAFAVLVAWSMPHAVLFLIGAKYSSLTSEVVLAVAAGALSVIAGAAGTLAAVRGVVVSPFISIPPSIAVQILLIATLPLDSVSSMFLLSLAVSAVQALAYIGNFVRWLSKPSAVPSG